MFYTAGSDSKDNARIVSDLFKDWPNLTQWPERDFVTLYEECLPQVVNLLGIFIPLTLEWEGLRGQTRRHELYGGFKIQTCLFTRTDPWGSI